jgi:maltose alpha-D-glucosyltransferase/alpha-amylase
VPNDAELGRNLLDLFLLEKAFYEIAYEAANRPAWISIPVRGILDLIAPPAASR